MSKREELLSVARERWLRKHGRYPVIVDVEEVDSEAKRIENDQRALAMQALGIEHTRIRVRFIDPQDGGPNV